MSDGNNDRFYEAYKVMAKIVRDHGEKYLPLFKRLHDEHLSKIAQADLINVALQVVKSPLE